MDHSYVVFVDFETTGLDPQNDKPVEFASVIYDPYKKRYITSEEYIFNTEVTLDQASMLDRICGIDSSIMELSSYNQIDFDDLLCFRLLRHDKISHFIAHNASFDAAFLRDLIHEPLFESIKWIDSMDYPFDEKVRSRSLGHIAADYGFLNPFAHRALSDCLTLMELTKRMSWEAILEKASKPTYMVISLEPFEKKDEVKKAGFLWDGDAKVWYKKMTEDEMKDCPFRIKVKEKREPFNLCYNMLSKYVYRT